MRSQELLQRLGVAVIGIPAIFGLIYLGKVAFLLFSMLVVGMALWEFYLLNEKKGVFPAKLWGTATAVLLGPVLYYQWSITLYFVMVILVLFLVELFRGRPHPMANVSHTLGGILYLGLFYSLMLIRQFPIRAGWEDPVGAWLIFLIFVSIWICDTAAYGFGSWLGRHPLYKRISPNKTWEGAIAGLLTGMATALLIQQICIPRLAWIDGLAIGLLVGLFGQLGDLIESMFKRDAGAKDSSHLLPGHGGILDRFDSPLMVGPLVFIYLVIRFPF